MLYLRELDIVFLSYGEPNAEENYHHLLESSPWAKRVDMVKGFASAHASAAKISETPFFITIDADSKVSPEFFDLPLQFEEENSDYTLSFSAKNIVNSLEYGNGSIKIWHKKQWEDRPGTAFRTHENAEDKKSEVEFCWRNTYLRAPGTYATNHPNGSEEQSFRAGYREGCKMLLDNGTPVPVRKVYPNNLERLKVWCTLGADVNFGNWCMYGARLGALHCLEGRNQEFIRDYEDFHHFFKHDVMDVSISPQLLPQLKEHGLHLEEFNSSQSAFLKSLYRNIPNEYDDISRFHIKD